MPILCGPPSSSPTSYTHGANNLFEFFQVLDLAPRSFASPALTFYGVSGSFYNHCLCPILPESIRLIFSWINTTIGGERCVLFCFLLISSHISSSLHPQSLSRYSPPPPPPQPYALPPSALLTTLHSAQLSPKSIFALSGRPRSKSLTHFHAPSNSTAPLSHHHFRIPSSSISPPSLSSPPTLHMYNIQSPPLPGWLRSARLHTERLNGSFLHHANVHIHRSHIHHHVTYLDSTEEVSEAVVMDSDV
jgi:hypothetical protein